MNVSQSALRLPQHYFAQMADSSLHRAAEATKSHGSEAAAELMLADLADMEKLTLAGPQPLHTLTHDLSAAVNQNANKADDPSQKGAGALSSLMLLSVVGDEPGVEHILSGAENFLDDDKIRQQFGVGFSTCQIQEAGVKALEVLSKQVDCQVATSLISSGASTVGILRALTSLQPAG